MQINLKQTSDRIDTGWAWITVHRFEDDNLARLDSFATQWTLDVSSESRTRIQFALFGGYTATVIYDFNNDIFQCDLCDSSCLVFIEVTHVRDMNKIIDLVEQLYMETYGNKQR